MHLCAACSVPASGSLQQEQAALRFTRVHLPALLQDCCWPALLLLLLVVLLSPPSGVRPNSDSPPGARPACPLPHPHLLLLLLLLTHTAPIDFAAADRPAAFLSWHRDSSTSKLGPPLAGNWLIPSHCLLCRDAGFQVKLPMKSPQYHVFAQTVQIELLLISGQ